MRDNEDREQRATNTLSTSARGSESCNSLVKPPVHVQTRSLRTPWIAAVHFTRIASDRLLGQLQHDRFSPFQFHCSAYSKCSWQQGRSSRARSATSTFPPSVNLPQPGEYFPVITLPTTRQRWRYYVEVRISTCSLVAPNTALVSCTLRRCDRRVIFNSQQRPHTT